MTTLRYVRSGAFWDAVVIRSARTLRQTLLAGTAVESLTDIGWWPVLAFIGLTVLNSALDALTTGLPEAEVQSEPSVPVAALVGKHRSEG